MKKIREGYKKSELGEIPSEWEIKSLDDICDFKGRIGWRGYTKDDLREFGPLVIGATQISNSNRLDFSNPTYLSKEKYEESPEIKVYLNDIILVKTGNTIGKVAIVDRKIGDATINPNTVLLKNIKCFNKYLYYIIASEIIQKPLKKSITVGAQPSVNQETLKKIEIPIPTEKEQEKISLILSTLDEEIDNVYGLLEKNRELKKGLMQKLLTNGIGHTKFKKTEIGEIPEAWEIKEIKDITTLITKGTTPMTYGFSFEEEGINFIKVENISESGKVDISTLLKISEECNKKLSRSEIIENDILISIAGSLGRTTVITKEVIPANTNQALAIVRLNNSVDVNYVNKALSSSYVQIYINKIGTVGAQPNLSLKQIGEFKIAIPSIEEQEKIASILSEVDEKIEQYENKKEKLGELKKGLMQQLLTGKIRVY